MRIVLLTTVIFFASCSALKNINLKPSSLETAMALRTLLDSSALDALALLRNVNSGGVQALLPDELQPVLAAMKTVGFGDKVDQAEAVIGDASLLMLTESEGIFKDAISQISFSDGAAIVLGGESAATGVLKNVMYKTVKQRYSERLDTELQKTEVKQYWPAAAQAYNLFSKNKVDSSLSDFLAERAVDGIFLAMGKQEKAKRSNYEKIGSPIVTKVFDYYTKNKQ